MDHSLFTHFHFHSLSQPALRAGRQGGRKSAANTIERGLGTERARLGTFRGLGTERARLGTFRGFDTERARLGTFNQNFEIFTQNEHLPVQRFFS